MRFTALIEALRSAAPANFIWGNGCSSLQLTSYRMSDKSLREALEKYKSNPLLHEIKARYYERTEGLEDLHSCLLALNDSQRKEVLTFEPNWANICLAELMRIGKVARVLTTNFDIHLPRTTAIYGMKLPLYRRTYPELHDAATPSIYLLAEASAETISGLIRRGAATGPWIVLGSSGLQFGLAETLLSVDRYQQGLYWVGHFNEKPPAPLRDKFFTPERNAHWIQAFDADSFLAYLTRAFSEFPPVSALAIAKRDYNGGALHAFAHRYPESKGYKELQPELDRVKRSDPAVVHEYLDALADHEELVARAGRYSHAFGLALQLLADHRSPRELKPYLLRAVECMEPDAAENRGNFPGLCCKLAQFTYGARADEWYARADAAYAQMDFGPSCGAIMPYGHLHPWADVLTEWACSEKRPEAEALFDRARKKFLEQIARCEEFAPDSRRTDAAGRVRKSTVFSFLLAFHQRARMVEPAAAHALLQEARKWLEELRSDALRYSELLARHLFLEALSEPARETALRAEAEEQFRFLLEKVPGQSFTILLNWSGALGELARARTGDAAIRLYAESEAKFQEAEKQDATQAVLYKNWSSILIDRARTSQPTLMDEARHRAEHAESLEPGQGGYNLACIAAENSDPGSVRHWLLRAASLGKIPRLTHILADDSFQKYQSKPWLRETLTEIFD